MQNPEPDQPAGWKPTVSTAAGASIGFITGQFVVAFCNQYLPHPLSPELASATTALLGGIASYFFPDGGRK